MQQYNNNHELLFFPQWRISGLNALFITHTIRGFALSLISLFGPLYIFYLFKEHYAFAPTTILLILTLIYFTLQKLSVLLLNYPIARIVNHFGFRWSMLAGNFFLAGNLLLLVLAQKEILLVLPAAMLEGFLIPLYWLPYHSIFVKDGKQQKFGQEISIMDMLGKLCAIAAPFLGGLIIVQFGFTLLYTITLILVLTAALPLFFMPHHVHPPLPALPKIWHGLWQSGFRKSLISFIAAGVEKEVNVILWSLFLFFLIGNYKTIGGLTSLASLATFLFLLLVGKIVDKGNRARLMRFGSVSNGFVWLVKIFVRTIPQIFVADFLHQIAGIFHSISFSAIFYTKADHKGVTQYLIWREWALYTGRLVGLILTILLIYLDVNWVFAFALAAIASFLTATITT